MDSERGEGGQAGLGRASMGAGTRGPGGGLRNGRRRLIQRSTFQLSPIRELKSAVVMSVLGEREEPVPVLLVPCTRADTTESS